jgi:hypothetical protein
MPERQDAAVDRIVPDNPPFPAKVDELVARNDRGTCPGQRHQHLHDPRLQLVSLIAELDAKLGRANPHPAKIEIPFVRKIDPSGRNLWPKIIHDRQ